MSIRGGHWLQKSDRDLNWNTHSEIDFQKVHESSSFKL